MLDRPAPDGARSVSWPWYHHVLTTELTPDARIILEDYSGVLPQDVESHIYSIVSPILPGYHTASFLKFALLKNRG